MKSEYFIEKEVEILKLLKENKNIINYEKVNKINVSNTDYVIFVMEYANAGVYFILFYFDVIFFLKNLSNYLEFERTSENVKKIEHILYNFTRQICFLLLFILFFFININLFNK
jgi:hypothetical protein